MILKLNLCHAEVLNCLPTLTHTVPSDMRSFIPEEDCGAFEDFLAQQNLQPRGRAPGGVIPHPPAVQVPEERGGGGEGKPSRQKQRSSRKQHSSHIADVDKFLQDIDAQMDAMVDTTNF